MQERHGVTAEDRGAFLRGEQGRLRVARAAGLDERGPNGLAEVIEAVLAVLDEVVALTTVPELGGVGDCLVEEQVEELGSCEDEE